MRRRSGGHPNHFGLRLFFSLPSGQVGHYAFRIGARPQGGFEVQDEECKIHSENALGPIHHFRIKSGYVVESSQPGPTASIDRLYLVSASGLPAFRPIYEALSRMGFYNLNPDRIRDLQSPDAGQLLARDGSNIASVLAQLTKHNPKRKQRIEESIFQRLSLASTESRQKLWVPKRRWSSASRSRDRETLGVSLLRTCQTGLFAHSEYWWLYSRPGMALALKYRWLV